MLLVEAEDRKYSPIPYLLFLSVFIAISIAGFILHPSPSGMGTHEELGLPPCGFLTMTGIPCPSCGLTTSITYLLHGYWAMSILSQPFGFILYLTLVSLTVISVCAMVKRIPFRSVIDSENFEKGQFLLLIMFIVSWIYKIIITKGSM